MSTTGSSAAPTPPATAGSRKRERLSDEAHSGGVTAANGSVVGENNNVVEPLSESASNAERISKKGLYQPQTVSIGDIDGQQAQATIHLKLLIPSLAAGGIIGKGGETIAEMQKKTGVRFKMSKANDYYPGTTERVCLLTGSPEGISDVIDFINDKIRERPDPHARVAMDFDSKVCAERDKQLKIIIPNTTAGVIIGKGGNYIKRIKDESGAFVQISQKSKDTSLPERVVTIIGDKQKNRDAMELIMEKIQEDPMSGSCLNINYSEVHGMVANFNPTGSPFATTSNGGNTSGLNSSFGSEGDSGVIGRNNPTSNGACNQLVLPLTTGGSLSVKLNIGPHRAAHDATFVSQCLGVLRATFRANGYSEAATEGLAQSFHCLASHGVLVFSNQSSQNSSNVPSLSGQQQSGNPAAAVTPTAPATTLVVDTSQRQHLMESPFPPASASTTPTFINANASGNHPGNPAAAASGSFLRGHEPFHHAHHEFAANGSAGPSNGQAAAAGSPFAPFHGGHQSSQFAGTSRYWGSSGNGAADVQIREAAGANLDPFGRQPPSPHHHQNIHIQLQPHQTLLPSSGATAINGSANQNANSFGLGPNTGLAAAVAAGSLSKSPVEHLRSAVHVQQHEAAESEKLELDINESIIGAIIGPNGRSISDIQQISGARIQISKKGIYAPGTRNRIVTVSGSKSAILAARNMIDERIGDEESKRVNERHSYQAAPPPPPPHHHNGSGTSR